MSRFLLRERALTATTSIGRPQRAASASRSRAISRTTARADRAQTGNDQLSDGARPSNRNWPVTGSGAC